MTTPLIDTTAFETFEASGWERQALGYDGFFSAITSRTADTLLDAARVGPGTRLLDIATGPGQIAGPGAERGATAVGIDIADAMVAIARRRWPAAEFRRADAHQLPFPDASFDAVTANFAILHLGRPEHAVGEAARVPRARRPAGRHRLGGTGTHRAVRRGAGRARCLRRRRRVRDRARVRGCRRGGRRRRPAGRRADRPVRSLLRCHLLARGSLPHHERPQADPLRAALLLGGSDSPAYLRHSTEAVAAALPNSRLTVLDGQQHIAMDTAPELLGDAVNSLLTQR